MSVQKITSKNLSYDACLPPFLLALHAQTAGASDARDPILASRRRPRGKGRSASEEAEDAPLIVDEDGNMIADVTVADDGGLVQATANTTEANGRGDDNGAKTTARSGKENEDEETQGQRVATFGSGGRKRKAGKVVGNNNVIGPDAPTERRGCKTDKKDDAHKPGSVADKTRPAKKAKKIKLSFDDDGE